MTLSPQSLPLSVAAVWREVLLCQQIDATMATAAMLRTLIVTVFYNLNPDKEEEEKQKAEETGKKRWSMGFDAALTALEDSADLTRRLRARADTLKRLGEEAVHESLKPNPTELAEALETAELWLRVLYIDVPGPDADADSE